MGWIGNAFLGQVGKPGGDEGLKGQSLARISCLDVPSEMISSSR